jgi:hypothetical protein
MPIEIPGFAPSREVSASADSEGNTLFHIKITPPDFMGVEPKVVSLTPDQYLDYLVWRTGTKPIQNAMSYLSSETRELLMSGLDSLDYKRLFPPEKE